MKNFFIKIGSGSHRVRGECVCAQQIVATESKSADGCVVSLWENGSWEIHLLLLFEAHYWPNVFCCLLRLRRTMKSGKSPLLATFSGSAKRMHFFTVLYTLIEPTAHFLLAIGTQIAGQTLALPAGRIAQCPVVAFARTATAQAKMAFGTIWK